MKKHVFGRQFKRDVNERKALFKGLMTSLVMHERIETTEQKAKAIRGSVEKLVTKAKNQGLGAERLLLPYLSEVAVKKMVGDVAPRFKKRPGGYTRIVKLGRRFNDDASMVFIEWVEKGKVLSAKGIRKDAKVVGSQEETVKENVASIKAPKEKKENKKVVEKKTAKKGSKKEDNK